MFIDSNKENGKFEEITEVEKIKLFDGDNTFKLVDAILPASGIFVDCTQSKLDFISIRSMVCDGKYKLMEAEFHIPLEIME